MDGKYLLYQIGPTLLGIWVITAQPHQAATRLTLLLTLPLGCACSQQKSLSVEQYQLLAHPPKETERR